MTNIPNQDDSHAAELGIDPEDMGTAKEIMDFDPVYDVQGPTSVQGNIKLPTQVSLSAFSPEKQSAIRQQLDAVPARMREQKERELVQEALYQNSFTLRVKGGGGASADPYQAASMEIANEREMANREALNIAEKLAEVDHWKPVTDPATGKQSQIAVNAVDGTRRTALENELARLQHKVEELDGGEGVRRMTKALGAAVSQRKQKETELRIVRNAKKLADDMEEQDRTEKQAAAFRSMKRDRLI
jgi:hypothetical protein